MTQSAEEGTRVTLEVIATNTPALSYQWFKDDSAIPDATQPTLEFDPVSLADAAAYSVVVSNDLGSVTSSRAILAVRPPGAPIIRVNGELVVSNVTETGSAIITIESGFTNGVIYYTLDGSTPDFASPVYDTPLTVSNDVVVRALGLDADTFETAEAPAVSVNILPVYTLTVSAMGNGIVTTDPPSGPYTNNSVVNVTATPDPGWLFDHWSGDVNGTVNPLTVTMNASMSVQAVFIPLFPVTVTTAGGGDVIASPAPGPYPSNSIVTVSATTSNGWTFLQWQGDVNDTNNPLSVAVNGPLNLSAVFGTSLDTSAIGSGTVMLNATNPVAYGTVVSVTATPDPGWLFDHWTGDGIGTDNPLAITTDAPKSVQAVFVPVVTVTYPVTVTTAGGGSVSLTPGPGPYPSNSVVSVTAMPDSGWAFLRWQGDAAGSDNPLSVTVNGPLSLSAVFGTVLNTSVVGSGAIALNVTNPIPYGTVISVTAVPDLGWAFDHWSGDVTGSVNPLSVTMTAPMSVQAVFLQLPVYPVTANTKGGGFVSLLPSPGPYPSNSVVSVSATPALGWTFLYWQGDASGTDNPLNLAVTRPMTVSAVFGTAVGTSVIGSGVIELSNPNLVPYGTILRATAIPDDGNYFVQWGGAITGTISPIQFVVATTNPVRAVFGVLQPGQVALSVRISGPGSVVVSPRQQVYSSGQVVSLTATPTGATNGFDGWTGDVVSSTNFIGVTLDTSKIVTATFSGIGSTLHITALPFGRVQVSWPYSPLYNSVLETTAQMGSGATWGTALPFGPSLSGSTAYAVFVATNQPQRYFRLKTSLSRSVCQYAIFYNTLLEFSTCATMTVNGPVHCNTNIYVGAGGSATLTFNALVSASGTISAPTNNGANWGNPTNFNSSWRTTFAGSPTNYVTNAPPVYVNVHPTSPHSLIEMPITALDLMTSLRLYNQAQVILLVSNTSVTTVIQRAPAGNLSVSDPNPYTTIYGTNVSALGPNLPFLSLTNTFYDGREKRTNITTQIDVGKYATWLGTNAQIVDAVIGKYPVGSGIYPTILYVADNRTAPANQLTVVRLTNGIAPPANGGQGFSVVTPNPLYIWGNYNQTNTSYLGSTNTSGGTVPCAIYSDALTLLSSSWSDRTSFSNFTSLSWNASGTNTVNAAIITGIVPTTDTDNLHFSGGVHNVPRLLEDWSSSTLWLNTSIVVLYNSTRATNQFLNPGPYYNPPTRKFSYDRNFLNLFQQPPGVPTISP